MGNNYEPDEGKTMGIEITTDHSKQEVRAIAYLCHFLDVDPARVEVEFGPGNSLDFKGPTIEGSVEAPHYSPKTGRMEGTKMIEFYWDEIRTKARNKRVPLFVEYNVDGLVKGTGEQRIISHMCEAANYQKGELQAIAERTEESFVS